ncbi:MAG: 16S rRNA (guanine(966)-N(2))-methyltransferase RsmD [Planctomycetota bacterium]|nr:MAG: 16S rRNA (guanine(966)-N(2))-methyltransferase RsmD [Planctomycetota bacterium]
MGGLRIIGGAWRSRRLKAPPGLATRPLTDRIRQSLFDCLGQRLDGLVVADCFAGSGCFGFEALSRGAAQVYAIESGPPAIQCLRDNAQSLEAGERWQLLVQMLPQAADRLPPCDIIFADPPFPWFQEQPELLASVLQALIQRLSAEGCLLLRGEQGQAMPAIPGCRIDDERGYGRSWVRWLYRD